MKHWGDFSLGDQQLVIQLGVFELHCFFFSGTFFLIHQGQTVATFRLFSQRFSLHQLGLLLVQVGWLKWNRVQKVFFFCSKKIRLKWNKRLKVSKGWGWSFKRLKWIQKKERKHFWFFLSLLVGREPFCFFVSVFSWKSLFFCPDLYSDPKSIEASQCSLPCFLEAKWW